jgi:hypothetical protein
MARGSGVMLPRVTSQGDIMFVYSPTGSYQYFDDLDSALYEAIQNGGLLYDDNGNPLKVESFLPGYGVVPDGTPGSGYLANGCPLNVALGQGFLPSQQQYLKQAGMTCQVSAPTGGGCGCGCTTPSGGGNRNIPGGGNVPGQASPWNYVTYGDLQGGPSDSVETMSDYANRLIDLARQQGKFMPIASGAK